MGGAAVDAAGVCEVAGVFAFPVVAATVVGDEAAGTAGADVASRTCCGEDAVEAGCEDSDGEAGRVVEPGGGSGVDSTVREVKPDGTVAVPRVAPVPVAAPGGGNGVDVMAPDVARTGRSGVRTGFTTDGDDAVGGTLVAGDRFAGGEELQAAATRIPTRPRARWARDACRSGAFAAASGPAAPHPATRRAILVTPQDCPRILRLLSRALAAFQASNPNRRS